ncbi:uncharacterized protein TRIADDRAFT_31125 [Trichoplax adhaerens]|uniref:cyclin-dependent kinase n=1 Tax=Trichoplax adhaerens TaxID=10228 RepID=B3S8G6_TRIAD|nr:hypothetical protein TRIADDRAFT_31125 [Trichoplax adhaerens]EDV20884.1 hypothetical protein TRIADDRAFT_31125 [Trichoplax adhaerens]|eukprot:XP_002116528.1 hypothetical protein TRIADDRAFT_31125 [Trichoplax adhaerens]
MHNQNLDSIKVKTLEEILQEKRNRSRSDSENIAETEDSPGSQFLTDTINFITKNVTSDTKDETTSAALELDEGEIISSGEENLNHIDDTKPTKRNHASQNDELDDYEEGEIKDRDEVERKEEFVPAADSSIISNRQISTTKLPPYLPAVQGCRSVEAFEWLNRIEEGTYGVVYRAKDLKSDEVVALKRLKMEKEREGFPITSLREINTLLKADHPNIVHVREIVVGSNMDKIYIVMEYVEHDLKTLMESMSQPFSISEVKCLMKQLLSAVQHLHDNWILHRDLKTSNLLLSHQGILKVGDFGLAREYGSPLKVYTSIVVTLWYRCPELLLGVKEYSTAVDMWSVGCIFGEFLVKKPLFPGKSEIDQLNKIFKDLGTPNDQIWSGFSELPVAKKVTFTEQPYNRLRDRFGAYLTDQGFDLLNRFLTYDPKKRISAEDALNHEYFQQEPRPLDPSMFPTWPAKSELMKRPSKANRSPTAPEGGGMCKIAGAADGFRITYATQGKAAGGAGFNLKF